MSSSLQSAQSIAQHRGKNITTPTLIQMEAVECGSTCLGIVLAHYGKWVSLGELRVACGVSRNGSKASNIVKAAKTYGCTAKGYKKDPAALLDMKMPLIVFWNFNHFVVIERIHKGMVYINDPNSGRYTINWAEFDQAYTGVVLSISPSENFETSGREPSLWRPLIKWVLNDRMAFALATIISLLLVIPTLIVPVFTRVMVDDILIGGMVGWFQPMMIAMALAIILQACLMWFQRKLLLRFEAKLTLVNCSQYFWHLLCLPIHFFTQRYPGEIGKRLDYNSTLSSLVANQLSNAFFSLIMIVFYGTIMFQYDTLLTLIAILTGLFNIGMLRLMMRHRNDANQKLLQEKGKMAAVSMGCLQMIETIKASGSESNFFTRWAGHQAKTTNCEQQLGFTQQLMMSVPEMLLAINNALILFIGGLRVMDGTLTIGELMSFQVLINLFLLPINTLVSLGDAMQDAHGLLNRIEDVTQHPIDPSLSNESNGQKKSKKYEQEDEQQQPQTEKLSGAISMKNLSFGYNNLEPPLIEDFNIDIQPGQRIAFVGGSGSGKSTMSKITSGLVEPWSGTLNYDGIERSKHSRYVLTQSIAMVNQDVFLFEGSIRDNLSLWDLTIDDSILLQACRDACVLEDIMLRPGGLDSPVEEGGRNFSGGQRQRLEIARALAQNPSILILDEATSALDALTESLFISNLERRGCTCLIVAHRMSTIRDCDYILVMSNGMVVESGNHDSLVANDGPYRQLISNV